MEDMWDVKAIDMQIDTLKVSLSNLKSVLASAQSSTCINDVKCNTSSMLAAICSSQISVVDNEIKLLTQMKQRIKFAVPNPDFFAIDKKP